MPTPPRNGIEGSVRVDKLAVGTRVMNAQGVVGSISYVNQGFVEIFWDSGFKQGNPEIGWRGLVDPVFTCSRCKEERPYSEGSDDEDVCDTCWCKRAEEE